MQDLIRFLNSYHPLSEDLEHHLLDILREQTFSKKELLLRNGSTSKQIFFIKSGLVRCFYMKGRQDVSCWFMKEGDVIISVDSFFSQKPSYENIQAIEDTITYSIYYQQLQNIYRKYPEFNFIGRVLTEKYYVLSERRVYSMRRQRPKERYAYMLEHHGDLVNRVPVQYLASYLGIGRDSLTVARRNKQR
ncbi:MAG: Crp/Fnr family transcriptional regulator [Bacteroidetes bacterium]|nr:Crp/Fnr family transcriptional regulator [Bacteroidota bacterium]